MGKQVYTPIVGSIDFHDSKNGLYAQLSAEKIRVEIDLKQYEISFGDDEPLIRLCEEVEADDAGVPSAIWQTMYTCIKNRRREAATLAGDPDADVLLENYDAALAWLDSAKKGGRDGAS